MTKATKVNEPKVSMNGIMENFSILTLHSGHPTGTRVIDLEALSLDGDIETEDDERLRDRLTLSMKIMQSEDFASMDEISREAQKVIRKKTARFPIAPNSPYRLVRNNRIKELQEILQKYEATFADAVETFCEEVYPDLRRKNIKKTVEAGLALYDDTLCHRPKASDRDTFKARLQSSLEGALPTAKAFRAKTYFEWRAFRMDLTAGADEDVLATRVVETMLESLRADLKENLGKIAEKIRTAKKYGDNSLSSDRQSIEDIIDQNLFSDGATMDIAKKALDEILTGTSGRVKRNRDKVAKELDTLAKQVSLDVSNGTVDAVGERFARVMKE